MQRKLPATMALAGLPLATLLALSVLSSAAAADEVEFHGYMRTAVGGTSKGGNLQCFEPGWPVRGKFRLGNECDSYGEAFLGLGFGDPNEAWAKYHLGLAYKPTDNSSYDKAADGNLELANTENYFEGGGFFDSDSLKSAKVWIGKRYLRKDIHITDYYYWNTSGTGAGMEHIALGEKAKLALAYMQGGKNATTASTVVPNWYTAKLYDIDANAGGKIEAELVLMQGTSATGSGVGSGTQLLLQHSQSGVLGGSNTAAVVLGNRAGGSGFEWLPAYWNGQSSNDDGSSVNFHDYLNFASKDGKWSGQAVLSYGSARNDKVSYVAVGIRPQYNFTANTSIALELSHQEGKNGSSTPSMDKITLAPQFTLSKGIYARPVFRMFVTHARWNDDAGSNVANGAFGTGRSGTTFGFQAEAWW